MNGKVISFVLFLCLVASFIPATAQNSDDPALLVERVASALVAADQLPAYHVSGASGFDIWYTIPSIDYTYNAIYQSNTDSQIINDPTTPNIQHQLIASVEAGTPQATDQAYALTAEIRQVQGKTYLNASYTVPDSTGNTLPNTWIEYDPDTSPNIWNGIGTLPPHFLTDNTTLSLLFWGQSTNDFARLLAENTTAATISESDVSSTITLTLKKQMILEMGLYNINSPVDQGIFDAVEIDPLVLTAVLDADNQLVSANYDVQFEIADLEISSFTDAPPNTTIDLTMLQNGQIEITPLEQPYSVVGVPDGVFDIASLPAYQAVNIPQDLPWWNDRVFYEVFVRSFRDSDGDGIGDLRGLIDNLDYLNDGDPTTTNDLGVTGLWLMPIMQSPSYHGYDVVDYYTVEEDYGTNEDFRELMDAAHKRGMVVIVDMVLNHTSSENPWFLASAESDPEYDDWYIWADDPASYLSPWGSTVWHRNGDRYFYGLFWEGMPDLNYENPDVTASMYEILDFWLTDMGADGFRLDAIRHLIEDGAIQENTPATLAWLENFDSYVHSIKPDALMVGEIWDNSAAIRPYIDDRVDIAFEFDLASAILEAVQLQMAGKLALTQNRILELYPVGQYATFLTNHDQNRVMSQLGEDEGAAQVAASILLTSSGVPFIYYGEEIGMVGEKPDERIRTPMQWNDERLSGGFSTASPWERMQNGYRTVNVAAEDENPASLLNHYRALVNLRNDHPALLHGAMQLVDADNRAVYSFLRYTEDEVVLVVINLSDEDVTEYALSAGNTLLKADPASELLYGDAAEVTAPEFLPIGGFTNYLPVDHLPARSTLVIRLK